MAKQMRKVLVVDDNGLNGQLLARLFQRLGWEAVVTDSGEEALARVDGSFALMLLDLRMPAMDGETVCRTFRARFPDSAMPIVAFTAHRMPEEKARLLELGFSDLLVKPASFGDVAELCRVLGLGH